MSQQQQTATRTEKYIFLPETPPKKTVVLQFTNLTETNNQRAEAILIVAYAGRHPLFKEMPTKDDFKAIGKILKKKMSQLNESPEKKEELSFRIQKAMREAKKNTGNAVASFSHEEKLSIVADEYIKAAQRHIDGGRSSTTVINGHKCHLLYPDKEKYKGAINFAAFPHHEILRETARKIGAEDFRYWIVWCGLKARDVVDEAAANRKMQRTVASRYNGCISGGLERW